MNDVYDVLNNSSGQSPSSPRLSKEEYAKMMQEKKQGLFTLANDQTKKVIDSKENFLQYLNLQSTVDYTVTNTLLVMAQYPKATQLKDFAHWRNMKKYVRSDAKGIDILEPGREYYRRDGSIGINYNVKTVYDIQQLQGKKIEPPLPVHYQMKELVGALIHRSEIQPQIVSQDVSLPSNVYLDTNQNTIYVHQGLQPETMVCGLLHAYSLVECVKQEIPEDKRKMISESAGYMLAKKYNLSGYETQFVQEGLSLFQEMDSKEIKAQLETIKNIRDKVSDRMEHGLYAQQNRKEKGNNERYEPSR